MSGFELNAYDADKFTDGVWSTIQGDSRLRIARAGNTEYLKARRRLEKEFRREHGDKLTPEQEQSLNCQAIAEGMLKDWENINLNGEPVAYSVEVGARYLKRNPKLLEFVLTKANDLEAWEREDLHEQSEKPAASSDGAATGTKKVSKTPTANTSE